MQLSFLCKGKSRQRLLMLFIFQDAHLLFFMLLKDSASSSLVEVRASQSLLTDGCWITQLCRSALDQALARCHFSAKSARAHAMRFVKSSFWPLWKWCGWCLIQHKACLKLPVQLSKNKFEPASWSLASSAMKYYLFISHGWSTLYAARDTLKIWFTSPLDQKQKFNIPIISSSSSAFVELGHLMTEKKSYRVTSVIIYKD